MYDAAYLYHPETISPFAGCAAQHLGERRGLVLRPPSDIYLNAETSRTCTTRPTSSVVMRVWTRALRLASSTPPPRLRILTWVHRTRRSAGKAETSCTSSVHVENASGPRLRVCTNEYRAKQASATGLNEKYRGLPVCCLSLNDKACMNDSSGRSWIGMVSKRVGFG